jgi:hypothetical protein
VGIDRPLDDDAPVAAMEADRTADRTDEPPDVSDVPPGAEPGIHAGGDRAVARAAYQVSVEVVYQNAARERWEATKPAFGAEWAEHTRAHPAPADASPDLDEAARASVERGCAEIRETEEKIVTPAMSRIEAEDPERHLVGLEFRCKGQDRIMEKVANWMAVQPDLTPEEALSIVKDPIRYTFQYAEGRYTDGVYADISRLKDDGFELVELRNSWGSEEYKGINSRWRVPQNGQLFEVQFHTQISFEAKQLTHPAYERLRNPATSETEQDQLVDFQRRVNAYVPEPRDARGIPNYP